MADPITELNKIGQSALALPNTIFGIESRHITEKMNVLSNEVMKAGAALPQMGQGLPQLPVLGAGLPPLPGMGAQQAPPAATKSMAVRGVQTTKSGSYLEK